MCQPMMPMTWSLRVGPPQQEPDTPPCRAAAVSPPDGERVHERKTAARFPQRVRTPGHRCLACAVVQHGDAGGGHAAPHDDVEAASGARAGVSERVGRKLTGQQNGRVSGRTTVEGTSHEPPGQRDLLGLAGERTALWRGYQARTPARQDRAGFGSEALSTRSKRPGKSTTGSVNSRRSSPICSSCLAPRVRKSCPRASYSTWFQPTPTPRRSRPPDSRSTSAACRATSAVWRCGRTRTPVANLQDYVWSGVARASAGSWVAAQLARNRRASSAGEPASALKATRARPGSAVSSITS
jgi:hypothetical protein